MKTGIKIKFITLTITILLSLSFSLSCTQYNYADIRWGKLELGFYSHEYDTYFNRYEKVNNTIIAGYTFSGHLNRVIKHHNMKVDMVEYFNLQGQLVARSKFTWSKRNTRCREEFYSCSNQSYVMEVDFAKNTFTYTKYTEETKEYRFLPKHIIKGDLDLNRVEYYFYANDNKTLLSKYVVEKNQDKNSDLQEQHFLHIKKKDGTTEKKLAYEVIKTDNELIMKEHMPARGKPFSFVVRDKVRYIRQDGKEEINNPLFIKNKYCITIESMNSSLYSEDISVYFDNLRLDFNIHKKNRTHTLELWNVIQIYPTEHMQFLKSYSFVFYHNLGYYFIEKKSFATTGYDEKYLDEKSKLKKYIR